MKRNSSSLLATSFIGVTVCDAVVIITLDAAAVSVVRVDAALETSVDTVPGTPVDAIVVDGSRTQCVCPDNGWNVPGGHGVH